MHICYLIILYWFEKHITVSLNQGTKTTANKKKFLINERIKFFNNQIQPHVVIVVF